MVTRYYTIYLTSLDASIPQCPLVVAVMPLELDNGCPEGIVRQVLDPRLASEVTKEAGNAT